MIKNVKNTVARTYIFSDLNGEEIVGTFYKKDLVHLHNIVVIVEDHEILSDIIMNLD